VNNRAITIYLWHNLLLVATVLVLDGLWNVGVLAEAVPWALGSTWAQFALVWLLLVVVILVVGWVEDIAARRPARLWPVPRALPRRRPKAVVPRSTGWLWMYPRSFREEASRAFLVPGPAVPLETDGRPGP
jgi:hypothetical protein